MKSLRVEKEPETIEDYQKLVAEKGLKDEYIYRAGTQIAKEYDDERYDAYYKWQGEKKAFEERRQKLEKMLDDALHNPNKEEGLKRFKEYEKLQRQLEKDIAKWQGRQPDTAKLLKDVLSRYRDMGSE